MSERHGTTLVIAIQDDPIFRDFNFSRLILDQVGDDDHDIILDLGHVVSLHSPGLANLVAIHVNLKKQGKTLTLHRVNDHNRRLLAATNLDKLFTLA
jgi:anti-anti-sigma factor